MDRHAYARSTPNYDDSRCGRADCGNQTNAVGLKWKGCRRNDP